MQHTQSGIILYLLARQSEDWTCT